MRSLIKEIKKRSINKVTIVSRYISSLILGTLNQKKFKNIDNFCFFIGYPRSGHTLVASLLNAHPNIMISIEYNILAYIDLFPCTKNQLYYAVTNNSKKFTNQRNNIWTGYSYEVKDCWQGKYSTLKVVGDKHGGLNATLLKENHDLLGKAEKVLRRKPKIIHVVRNPFDIITTHTLRFFPNKNRENEFNTLDLLPTIKKFLNSAAEIERIKKEGVYETFDLYHENLISDPKEQLNNLISFLGLRPYDYYLENCSKIIFNEPNKSRFLIEWPSELISFLEANIKKYSFLRHYHYRD